MDVFIKKNISKASLAIKNILGQEVYQQDFSALSFKNNFTIGLSFLPKGIYLLDVAIGDERCIRKIVKG